MLLKGAPSGQFDWTDLAKTARDAGILALGSGGVYLLEWATRSDFGQWGVFVSSAATLALIVLRRFLADNSKVGN